LLRILMKRHLRHAIYQLSQVVRKGFQTPRRIARITCCARRYACLCTCICDFAERRDWLPAFASMSKSQSASFASNPVFPVSYIRNRTVRMRGCVIAVSDRVCFGVESHIHAQYEHLSLSSWLPRRNIAITDRNSWVASVERV
jgi:hypothetical protein